jgi:hypothetical protein
MKVVISVFVALPITIWFGGSVARTKLRVRSTGC